ncbi:MAG: GNAT family N-acetyltransferase [Acidobacteriota bacterium]|nr:GNAT family N-acetyltransferase [Acidobacteriota bacterium]
MERPDVIDVPEDGHDRAIQALTAAFIADPLMRWMFPEAADYLEYFPRLVRVFVGPAFEQGAAHATPGFEGAAIWYAPGGGPDEEGVGKLVAEAFSSSKREEVFALFEEMDRHHPNDREVWYLPTIGVDPAYQRRGIGAALLQRQFGVCDQAGIQAYLESSNPANMSLYERHGFRTTGQIQVGSSPVVHPMLRPIGG